MRFTAPLACALLLAAPPAHAIGRVLSNDGTAQVKELRVATAVSADQRTSWSSVAITGHAGKVAWVVPVAAGAFIDPAGDAWLGALDAGTAPRVVAPGTAPTGCAGGSRVDDTTAPEPSSRMQPAEVAVLGSIDDVQAWTSSEGLSLAGDDLVRLDDAGSRFVGLRYELPEGGGTTSALRIVEPVADAPLPLALVAAAGHSVPALLWVVGDRRVGIVDSTEIPATIVDPLWIWREARSDYATRSATFLDDSSAITWLIEARDATSLGSYRVITAADGAIPPVIDTYFKRAAPGHESGCISAAAATRKLGWPVARTCADGLLARVPGATGVDPSCKQAVATGQTDPDTLRCDGADDLALALSGLRPDLAQVTRLHGLIDPGDKPVELATSTSGDASPVVSAKHSDIYGCGGMPGAGGSGGNVSPGGGNGGGLGAGPGDGLGGPGGDGTGYGDGTGTGPYQDPPVQLNVQVNSSCSGDSSSSSSSNNSCSGDSSSSSSSSNGSTCSGDSSSSSSDGNTCSGDSSSSSSDGNTCSGNSSSSSSDGNTCSGDSSSGSSDTCSGGSSGGGSSCAVSRRARPRASVLLLALAGIAFPLRRRARRDSRLGRAL